MGSLPFNVPSIKTGMMLFACSILSVIAVCRPHVLCPKRDETFDFRNYIY